MPDPLHLARSPVHLGLGAKAVSQPEFTGQMSWYMAYRQRHAADGAEGRLVAMHTFTSDWPTWEMHPKGDEVVVVVEGEMTLVQEIDGANVETTLGPGQYAINPRGVWHAGKIPTFAKALFITAGEGTENAVR